MKDIILLSIFILGIVISFVNIYELIRTRKLRKKKHYEQTKTISN